MQVTLGAGAALALALGAARADTDAFGIERRMPSAAPALEWNSLHWGSGAERPIAGRDPADPTGWSLQRGVTALMAVDGAGVMRMGGAEPRFYVDGTFSGPRGFFREIEFTGYYQRVGTDGAAYGGFVVGLRSGAEGHGAAGDPCDANTYYVRMRHDGKWDFAKELRHPAAEVGKTGRLFAGGLPAERWLGMKALVRNLPGLPRPGAVKLEMYVDTLSGGDVSGGGRWEKVAEVVDSGQWRAPAPGCAFPETAVIAEGGGVVLVRNTGVQEARYRHMSVREIAEGTSGIREPRRGSRFRPRRVPEGLPPGTDGWAGYHARNLGGRLLAAGGLGPGAACLPDPGGPARGVAALEAAEPGGVHWLVIP